MLPTAKQAAGATSPPPTGTPSANKEQGASAPTQAKEQKPKPKSDLKTIKMTIELLASGHDVFEALMDPQKVQQWTRAKAQISKQPGSPFVLFEGAISGEVVSVVQDKKIEQKWRLKDWPQGLLLFPTHRLLLPTELTLPPVGHYSHVIMELEQGSNSTEIVLEQTDVPSEYFDATTENWNRFFWNQLKGIYGWGILD